MKWVRIILAGLAIWGLTLIWLELNLILTSPLVLGLLIGLLMIIPAYWLGRYFEQGQNQSNGAGTDCRDNDISIPQPQSHRSRHQHPTLPMRIGNLTNHSCATRPMRLGLQR